ncbi:DUF6789 family protein [Sphaerisporangium aureirubrum]|uniref:DUF6789 family protein n=1 Tax=Sphaerisporangium aureirubrum TaxID=1544736 RepID=A0ABW1ND00_9ACTN
MMTRDLVHGAVSGALATVAMSAAMVAGDQAGMMKGGHPPKHIARAVLPGHKRRPKPGEGVLGAVAHMGFGAAAGALFAMIADGGRARVSRGVAYGLTIWVVSYQGWVPRLGILPPVHRDHPERQTVMAAAHVVYGAALVLALNRLRSRATAKASQPSSPMPLPAGEAIPAH